MDDKYESLSIINLVFEQLLRYQTTFCESSVNGQPVFKLRCQDALCFCAPELYNCACRSKSNYFCDATAAGVQKAAKVGRRRVRCCVSKEK
jgi:hypothetical protein